MKYFNEKINKTIEVDATITSPDWEEVKEKKSIPKKEGKKSEDKMQKNKND